MEKRDKSLTEWKSSTTPKPIKTNPITYPMMAIHISYDGPLDLALCKTREQKTYSNTQKQWSWIVEKISSTHRTAETFADYISFPRTKQDTIKDIGGFCSGYLRAGRRLASNIAHKQLITLDLDTAQVETWDIFTMLFECAGAVYSTHKHAPETPRLRLLIPLDREVFPDEYQAISRWIAGEIGIEAFDNTGFQPHRMMYWPSTAKDGHYYFNYQDGPWLCADEILARYNDWHDTTEWPISERVHKVIDRLAKKQGDPLQKPGVVGAWCRVYGIAEVIAKHLADVYEPCDVEDRYTYKEGSTSAGLIIYDDKFAYSHHGTDPISGKLCNAFDLVRIHKFGLRDEDAKEDTPGNRLPSFKDMIHLATQDPAVRQLIGSEKLAEAFADFDDDYAAGADKGAPVVDPDDQKWLEKLDIDKNGNYLSTIKNVVLIMQNDPRLKGAIGLNKFENREMLLRDLPWKKLTAETRYMQDRDDANFRHYLEQYYGISAAAKVKDAVDIVVGNNGFHPVRDYLTAVEWDGQPRLETLLIDYLGADDNLYVRTVTRKAFVAAVARVFEPGIKFDNMLITIGKQGIGKSTLIDKMGSPWFTDSFNFHMLGTKQADEQLQGSWLVEVGELSGLPKAEIESAISFLSKREDRFRVAYGKRVDYFPRQCIFFGTTNKDRPLRDAEGNRRFWPVTTHSNAATKNIFTDLDLDVRGQLWAEAYCCFIAGEQLHLSEEVRQLAEKMQQWHTDTDDRIGMILAYLDQPLPESWDEKSIAQRREFLSADEDFKEAGVSLRTVVCAAEIWCEVLGGFLKDMNNHNTKFIHQMLQKSGDWEHSKGNRKFAIYGYQRAYVRTNTESLCLSESTNRQT